MPRTSTTCEHCGAVAAYQRTQLRDIESQAAANQHVGMMPIVKNGDHHVYRCPKCEHLTRIPSNW